MPYIQLRGRNWQFCLRVPPHLVPRYGTFIRKSLGAVDRAEAQAHAFRLAGEWKLRFVAVQQVVVPPTEHSNAQISPDPTSEPVCAGAGLSLPTPSPRALLPQPVRYWTALLRYWSGLNRDRSPSTLREADATVRRFSEITRRLPTQVTRVDVSHFRDRLIAQRLSHLTVAKKMSILSAILQSAYDAGYLPANHARGLKIPRPRVTPVRRRAFTTDELRCIVSSPAYNRGYRPRGGGGEAIFWLPLLALCTGARLEELCQLNVADIAVDPIHGPLLRITDGPGQHLKTAGSRRTVPLHPELIESGFLEYLQRIAVGGHTRVFPFLKPDHDGRSGGHFSKFWGRYLRGDYGCGIRDRAVCFHAFRHTFKGLCREAGIAEEVHDGLTGHVSGSVGRRYGTIPISRLVAAIHSIKLPVALPRLCG